MRLKLLERSFKHFVHHGVQRAPGDCIGNDFAVVQIHDGRQIELLASHFELGDVRGPFFIKVLGLEITLENVGRSLAYFALVRAVFLHSHQALQAKLPHQFLHRLVVHKMACAPQRRRDTTIAIPAFMIVENCLNQVFQPGVLIARLQYLLLIVKSAARQTGKLQQATQRMPQSQFGYDLRFFCCAIRCFF